MKFLKVLKYTYHMTQQLHSEVLPKRNENIHPVKDLYMNVHNTIFFIIVPNWK